MSRYTILPGETAEQWIARDAALDQDLAIFDQLTANIRDLTTQTGRQPSTDGFFRAWLALMFQNMSVEDRQMTIERFREYDSELLMLKMAGEPA